MKVQFQIQFSYVLGKRKKKIEVWIPFFEIAGKQKTKMEIRILFSNVVGKRLALGYTHSKWFCVVVRRPFIAELSFSLMHLPDNYLTDSFDTWLCLHPLRSKNSLNCFMHVYTPCFTLHLQSLSDNLCLRGRTSKSMRNILNDIRTTTLGSFTLTFAQETVIASIWFLKTNFHAF